jgi:hypothetical protein
MATNCGICKRILDQPGDPLSVDCGGDCWGCISVVEAEMQGIPLEAYRAEPERYVRERTEHRPEVAMQMGKTVWAMALVLCACVWWFLNPIRLHQKVQVAGVTLPVPFGWVAQITPSQAGSISRVNLHRAFLPYIPQMTATVSRGVREPYTDYSAAQLLEVLYQDGAHYTNQQTFDLNSDKYHSLCVEVTRIGPASGATYSARSAGRITHLLTCVVVGTPLIFDFWSQGAVDDDAEKILGSLI